MTTLLTGASGFLGGWIARRLEPHPGELRVLARPTSDLSGLHDLPVEVVIGDLLDPDSVRGALEGIQRVIHAAGYISFRRDDAARVRRANVEATANLFEAALEAGVEKVVYTASIFSLGYAPDPARPVDESATFNAPELRDIPYLRAKLDAEHHAQEMIARGLPLVRLYPGLALGPGDRSRSSSGAIDAWLHGRLPALITGGGICLMDVRDAAAAHVAALRQGVPGRRYLATGYNVTLVDLFNRLASITGQPPPVVRLPARFSGPLGHLAEMLGLFPRLGASQIRLMGYHWWYDDTRAQQELGLTFRPLDETLAESISWLLTN